jgi:hypothetical protein
VDTGKQPGENPERTPAGLFMAGNTVGRKGGRPRGSRNKSTVELREAVLRALDAAGGVEYLTSLAKAQPEQFTKLLLRLLPQEAASDDGSVVRLVDPDPDV